MNKVIENDVEKTKDEIVNEVKTRVESLWEKRDQGAIELGFALLELTDSIDDGDSGKTWFELCDSISFADYCRKLGMINRVEYKYRNAAINIKENRPDFVDGYKLVDDIDYLPGYSLLTRVEENKKELKKIGGAWEDLIELLYEEKESRYNIEVKITDYLTKDKIRTSSKSIGKVDLEKSDSQTALIEIRRVLLLKLPDDIDKDDFDKKFNDLVELFGISLDVAA
jgi:hypothetical protein|tara:strand:- start:196 stop:870 length:675 start_codon:yes stop_codon:yes gene_type:complete